ncbi:MAG TPA: hypothetical protein VFK85_03555 [Anaeromyxobacteraceae bacterium]|nr:hypothetical protein [Anaeromyxobacteraceae bacterium]
MKRPRIFANLRVGKPDTKPSAPSHVRGIRGGNQVGAADQVGFYSTGPAPRRGVSDIKATAARSTGINPRARNPIDPRSPNLPPA